MPASLEQFVQTVAASGLLTSAELDAFQKGLPAERRPQDVQALARELVHQGKLTRYQATRLYQGRPQGLVLGSYVVLDQIGAGGMGQVFKAQHRRMDRIVALKVLPESVGRNADALRRFQREVRAAARLDHPNIVAAYDADQAAGVHFLVMQYVDGSDLATLVKTNGPVTPHLALDCIRQAACGLEYAHAQGVVHRDIKPANLLLDKQGRVKLLDLGLARFDAPGNEAGGADDVGLTNSGMIMGTVDYMSPEQALNTKHADHRSDIYALGCTFHYLITGQAPYRGETPMEKLLAHREQPVPPLRPPQGQLTPGVEAVYQRMMAKDPNARYQSCRELAADLERCRAGRGVESPAPAAGEQSEYAQFLDFLQAQPSTSAGPRGAAAATAAALPRTSLLENETDPNAGVTARLTESATRAGAGARSGRQWRMPAAIGTAVAILLVLLGVVFYNRDRRGPSATASDPPDAQGADPVAKANIQPPVRPKYSHREFAARVLDAGGTISLVLSGESKAKPITSADDVPAASFSWHTVDFNGQRAVGDDDLREFEGVPGLTSLNLYGTRITDESIPLLVRIPGLERLTLNSAGLTGDGLAALADLRSLKVLSLSGLPVSDSVLEQLAKTPRLEQLNVTSSQVTAAGVQRFRKARPNCSLTWTIADSERKAAESVLSLEGTVGIAQGDGPTLRVDRLAGLPPEAFVVRSVSVARFSDRNLPALAALPHLIALNLDGSQISNDGAAPLGRMAGLVNLSLGSTPIADAALKHLEPLTALKELSLAGTAISDAGLPDLAALRSLRKLNFANTALTGDRIESLKVLAELDSLDLDGTQLADNQLARLRSLPRLRSLGLANTRVSDAGLESLAALKSLEDLRLSGTRVTDAGLDELSALPSLKSLELADTDTSDLGLMQLARLKALVRLSLTNTRVTQAGADQLQAAIPKCQVAWSTADPDRHAAQWVRAKGGSVSIREGRGKPREIETGAPLPDAAFQVQAIRLEGNQAVSDTDLAGFAGLAQLEVLVLNDTRIGDAALAHLQGSASVASLELAGTLITDAGLAHLAGMKRLLELRLDRTGVTDAGLAVLKPLKKLAGLHLAGTQITNSGMAHVKGMTALSTLTLSDTNVSNEGLGELAALYLLDTLHLERTQITDRGLGQLAGLRNLQSLYLDDNPISDAGLAHVATLGLLARLHLAGTNATDKGLAHLENLPALTLLNVKRTGVTQAGIEKLRAARPSCQIECDF